MKSGGKNGGKNGGGGGGKWGGKNGGGGGGAEVVAEIGVAANETALPLELPCTSVNQNVVLAARPKSPTLTEPVDGTRLVTSLAIGLPVCEP